MKGGLTRLIQYSDAESNFCTGIPDFAVFAIMSF